MDGPGLPERKSCTWMLSTMSGGKGMSDSAYSCCPVCEDGSAECEYLACCGSGPTACTECNIPAVCVCGDGCGVVTKDNREIVCCEQSL